MSSGEIFIDRPDLHTYNVLITSTEVRLGYHFTATVWYRIGLRKLKQFEHSFGLRWALGTMSWTKSLSKSTLCRMRWMNEWLSFQHLTLESRGSLSEVSETESLPEVRKLVKKLTEIISQYVAATRKWEGAEGELESYINTHLSPHLSGFQQRKWILTLSAERCTAVIFGWT